MVRQLIGGFVLFAVGFVVGQVYQMPQTPELMTIGSDQQESGQQTTIVRLGVPEWGFRADDPMAPKEWKYNPYMMSVDEKFAVVDDSGSDNLGFGKRQLGVAPEGDSEVESKRKLPVPMMGPVPIAIDFAVPLLAQKTDVESAE